MRTALKQALGKSQFEGVSAERSRLMGKIRGKGNKSTEVRFRMLLVRAGIRGWRLHPKLPGKPDLLFIEQDVAVFLDGCFWHGCDICGHTPKTRSEFWAKKFETNSARDTRVTKELQGLGFRVLRLWEHELRDPGTVLCTLQQVLL